MAGSKTDVFEIAILKLIFQNIACANIGDTAGLQPSAAPGNLYISLHTDVLSDTSNQTTNETAYTNYLRVAVARSAAGWTVTSATDNYAENLAAVTFALCGATGATIKYFGVGTASSGAGGTLLYWGQLTADLVVSAGITPSFTAGALHVYED